MDLQRTGQDVFSICTTDDLGAAGYPGGVVPTPAAVGLSAICAAKDSACSEERGDSFCSYSAVSGLWRCLWELQSVAGNLSKTLICIGRFVFHFLCCGTRTMLGCLLSSKLMAQHALVCD
jgi:hypothetical protein